MNCIDGRTVMQDEYDVVYGFYNHHNTSVNRPLASVAFHQPEDINDSSLLEEAIRTYVDRGIKEVYGLNLIEFLDLPLDIIEMLMNVAGDVQGKKASVLDSIERDIAKK